ncbi:mitotic interactor and substrate of PLK1 [Vulpes lagopus]|uniref:mitotic interactor and substrate of PLK1 n=1 Tax=Vulpes lagopus TaxID=494514 RepID=UPI001BC90992|nr:mitotic interactor and substrate of PLK1 [Vulpes lagopus]XP_041620408.1 mitotic interactor and substrate of PLK1 [Vulpes lagopus]
MDRVTRYPIFSIPHSPRLAGLAPDEDASYTFEVLDVAPEASGWGQDRPPAWPTDREAWSSTARTGASLPGQPSPWTLSGKADGEEEVTAFRRDARDAQARGPRDLERERRAVIQDQALRKSSTVATLHGAPGPQDPRDPSQAPSGPPGDDAVDREQIDFLAARQQFLSLEQASAGGALHPPTRAAPTRAPRGASQAPRPPSGLFLANGYMVPPKPQEREVVLEEKSESIPPAASGVRAAGDPGSPDQGGAPELPTETPIEREIRLAQEREADLRERRGLPQAHAQQELVQVPSRPLLARVGLLPAPRRERGRPSLYVQRDLAQETQREEAHRQGLQSRRGAASPGAQPGLRRARSSDSVLDEPGKVSRAPPEPSPPYLRPGSPPPTSPASQAPGPTRGAPAGEAARARTPLSGPSGKPWGARQRSSRPPSGPPRTHGAVIPWEYFHLSPLRFRVPDAPPPEAARARGWDRGSALASRLQRSASSELLDREVESVLRREREVAAERRSALFPEVFSPPAEDEDREPGSRSSSAASGVTGRYSVSEAHFFSPVQLHSGLVWTVDSPAQAAPGQRKKEQRYASINSLDRIDSEVLEATRVTHHKNAMAQRWEAGIFSKD